MTTSVIIAYSSPIDDESEREFLAWYRDVHIPEVRAAVPGVKGTATYRLWQREPSSEPSRFVTVYEVETAQADAAAQALGAAASGFTLTPALDRLENAPTTQFADLIQ